MDIHPKALENLGKLTAAQARRFFRAFPIEISWIHQQQLIEAAGCERNADGFVPYSQRGYRSPFLVD